MASSSSNPSSNGSPPGGSGGGGATSLFPSIVELNVGGVHYTTTLSTLTTRDADSLIGQMFSGRLKSGGQQPAVRDAKGNYFIDRDGVLFRYTLDYLRTGKVTLPDNFGECERLRQEADYFQMAGMKAALPSVASVSGGVGGGGVQATTTEDGELVVLPLPVARASGYITIGYRGTFAFGRDGLADVKFRKLSRILVCGRVALCREVSLSHLISFSCVFVRIKNEFKLL